MDGLDRLLRGYATTGPQLYVRDSKTDEFQLRTPRPAWQDLPRDLDFERQASSTFRNVPCNRKPQITHHHGIQWDVQYNPGAYYSPRGFSRHVYDPLDQEAFLYFKSRECVFPNKPKPPPPPKPKPPPPEVPRLPARRQSFAKLVAAAAQPPVTSQPPITKQPAPKPPPPPAPKSCCWPCMDEKCYPCPCCDDCCCACCNITCCPGCYNCWTGIGRALKCIFCCGCCKK